MSHCATRVACPRIFWMLKVMFRSVVININLFVLLKMGVVFSFSIFLHFSSWLFIPYNQLHTEFSIPFVSFSLWNVLATSQATGHLGQDGVPQYFTCMIPSTISLKCLFYSWNAMLLKKKFGFVDLKHFFVLSLWI